MAKNKREIAPFPDNMTRIHRALVQISEYCLYALLIIQPTIGFGSVLTRRQRLESGLRRTRSHSVAIRKRRLDVNYFQPTKEL